MLTAKWFTCELKKGKAQMASIAVNDKVYCGSGINSASGNICTLSNMVKIRFKYTNFNFCVHNSKK